MTLQRAVVTGPDMDPALFFIIWWVSKKILGYPARNHYP